MLPAQDSHLMSQGDAFELQCEATTNPERERGTEGGQKREHADDGVTAAPENSMLSRLFGVLSMHRHRPALQRGARIETSSSKALS